MEEKKMAIAKMAERRMTVVEQTARNLANQGKKLAVRVFDPATGHVVKTEKLFASTPELRALIPSANIEVRTPLGLLMNPAVIAFTPERIDAKAAEMENLFEIANPRASTVQNLPEMIKIAAGSFPVEGSQLFGSRKPDADRVNISAFEASKFPVTVAAYREFYDATNHGAKIAGQAGAEEQKSLVNDRSKDNHPMVYANNADRQAYVAWLSEKTGDKYDLLTAAESEYIMRGATGRTYPSGNEWRRAPYSNTNATAPVDSFPSGATPEGVAGFGIVWEATRSWYGEYDPEITDNPQGPSKGEGDCIEVRGGSAWNSSQAYFRGAIRHFINPDDRVNGVGFRLAKRT